jgi:hypothetical protein
VHLRSVFFFNTCLCLLSCIRSYVLSVFTEAHTLISCGDTYIVSGMGGGLVIQQRGFFPSREGLRLSWLGGYGSCMEWNGGGLIIEQPWILPFSRRVAVVLASWLLVVTKGHIYYYCGSISYSG